MQSHWIINVAKRQMGARSGTRYAHFFRVQVDGYNADEMRAVASSLAHAYELPEYKITVTRWECAGQDLAMGEWDVDVAV